MTFKAEDTILCYSHTYNAVKNIAEQMADKWGCQVHYLELKLPIQSEDEIVDVSRGLKSTLKRNLTSSQVPNSPNFKTPKLTLPN